MIFIQISFNTRQQISSPKESTFCHKELLSNLSISPQKKEKILFSLPKEINKPCIGLIRATFRDRERYENNVTSYLSCKWGSGGECSPSNSLILKPLFPREEIKGRKNRRVVFRRLRLPLWKLREDGSSLSVDPKWPSRRIARLGRLNERQMNTLGPIQFRGANGIHAWNYLNETLSRAPSPPPFVNFLHSNR